MMEKHIETPDAQISTALTAAPETVILISPILLGQSEAWRRFIQELAASRRIDYERSRRRLGIARERIWLVETRRGDIALISLEAGQLDRTRQQLAASSDPFDGWFREQLLALQGLDLTRPQTLCPPNLVFEWSKP